MNAKLFRITLLTVMLGHSVLALCAGSQFGPGAVDIPSELAIQKSFDLVFGPDKTGPPMAATSQSFAHFDDESDYRPKFTDTQEFTTDKLRGGDGTRTGIARGEYWNAILSEPHRNFYDATNELASIMECAIYCLEADHIVELQVVASVLNVWHEHRGFTLEMLKANNANTDAFWTALNHRNGNNILMVSRIVNSAKGHLVTKLTNDVLEFGYCNNVPAPEGGMDAYRLGLTRPYLHFVRNSAIQIATNLDTAIRAVAQDNGIADPGNQATSIAQVYDWVVKCILGLVGQASHTEP